MADWYGTCRSNYFRVKDVGAFTSMLTTYDAELIEDKEGRVGFLSKDDYGAIPTRFDDQDDMISITDEIEEHLAENEVCVVIEAGAERSRYITGIAMAIAWNGKRAYISLDGIYDLAKSRFGHEVNITEAKY